MDEKRILFILNPRAGNERRKGLAGEIKKRCESARISYKIIILKKRKDTRNSLMRVVKDFAPYIIVAGGGDGTVSLTASLCVRSKALLGIIPIGSGNAMSKNLNIPTNIHKALDIIFTGHSECIDIMEINNKECIHLCDIGFNARIVRDFQKGDIRGLIGYALAFVKELFNFRFFDYRLQCNGKEYTDKAFSITITNTKIYGTRAAINPLGKIDDGLFEICIVKKFPSYMFIPLTIMLFRKRLPLSKYSQYLHCSKAKYFNTSHQPLQVDGEPVRMPDVFDICEWPQALYVRVP